MQTINSLKSVPTSDAVKQQPVIPVDQQKAQTATDQQLPGELTSTTYEQGAEPYGGDPAIQAQWSALSPEDQKRYKPVFDAAYSKLGA